MRLIDADTLMNDIKSDAEKAINEGDNTGSFWLGYIGGLVSIQPTAQLEIIRCKDCNYACIDPERESDEIYCSENDFWMDDDFYCGYAERRTDER